MANTITGMVKVFYNNYLVDYANTITLSSGTNSNYLYDFDRSTKWQSSGSNDTTTESIIVTFTSSQSISRLLFINENWKDYHVYYWNGSDYADFASVYKDATTAVASSISATANTNTSLYYEFTEVSTTKIKIEITKTLTTDAEKYLYELYIGKEIGTFTADLASLPNSIKPVYSNTNAIYNKKSNGGIIKYERSNKFNAQFDIKELLNTADQTIINIMYDQGQFAILLCGSIPYTQRGWRNQDLFNVIIDGNEQVEFSIGRVAMMGLSHSFVLLEQ
jgi:hypothetical protein